MKCPHCRNTLNSIIEYLSEHQQIELDENGEMTGIGPRHNDGIKDVACGSCLQSPFDSPVLEIQGLVERMSEY